MGEHTPTPWSFSDGFILAGGEALPVVGVQVPMVVGPKRLQAVENSKFIVEAVNIYDRNRATIEALVGALEKIACFDDKAASEILNTTGSYAAFDEPGSVEIARSALLLARGSAGNE